MRLGPALMGSAGVGALGWALDAGYAFDFPANAARFTDRPAGNVITAPEDFSNAAWTKTDTTITTNAETAPDGTLTTDLATEGSAGTAQVGQGVTVSSGATVAISSFLKRGNTDWVRVTCINASNFFRAWFNLGTGAVGTSGAGGTGVLIGASITASANGFYRVTLTGSIPATTSYSVFFNTASADNSATRVSGGTYYPWGVRVEEGSVAANYLTREARYYALTSVPGWTFSRASTGYALNNAGQLVAFASGAPRITDRGFLAEGSRTNLCLQSQTLTASGWPLERASVSADYATAPDGTLAADRLVEDSTASNTHDIYRNITIATATTYVMSTYIKADGRSACRLIIGDTGGNNGARADFNLSNGTVHASATSGTGWTLVGSGIEALANGWYRIWVAGTSAASTGGIIILWMSNTPGTITYSGDGASALQLWGMQLEAAAFPSSYIPTTTAAVTRAADSLTITGVTGLDYPASLYLRFRRGVDTAAAETWFQLDDGTANERVRLGITSADLLEAVMTDGGVDTAAPSVAGALAVGTIYNAAARLKVNDVQACRSGTLGTADVSATVPAAPTNIRFGGGIAAAASCFGYIERAAIFGDLTDASLQSVAP